MTTAGVDFVRTADWTGKKVTVMGLGLFGGGAGVARYFAGKGATVTVTDLKPAAELSDSLASLVGLPLRLRLGGHDKEDFVASDLVVANPAVPPDAELLQLARGSGTAVESEISIFFRHCPARIVGITGSNGKTTTTRLMGEIFRACGRTTFVGGNVGGSILEQIDDIEPGDTVVLELSSFQAEELDRIGRSPHVSVVLNLTPNHLDRHKEMKAYARAKQALLRHQREGDVAVLCGDDAEVRGWEAIGPARTIFFSVQCEPENGLFLRDGWVVARLDGQQRRVVPVDRIRLLGEFNRSNVLAAVTPPLLFGCPVQGIADAVASFGGVEHRLELIARDGDVAYYNDSIATTPESTLGALDAVPGPVWLVAGGYDKGVPIHDLAVGIARKAAGVALIGETATRLHDAIQEQTALHGAGPVVRRCDGLEEAVDWLAERGRDGGSVVLSPGFASYDQFINFVERGNQFKELVRRRL